MTEVATTSSTKLQPPSSIKFQSSVMVIASSTILGSSVVSTSFFDTITLPTLVLDLSSILVSVPSVGTISFFTTSPTVSTIVSILDSKALSTMTVGPKAKPSTRFLSKGMDIEEDIDLDEEIEILKWDFSNLTADQMHTVGELFQKKEKQKKLREEKDREYKIIDDAKNILSEAIGIEVYSSEPILLQLAEVVQKFNEDSSG